LSKVDWEKIEQEYITQGLSYRELAKKYGVSPRAVAHQAAKREWVRKREAYCNVISTVLQQSAIEETVEISALIYRIGRLILERFLARLEAGGIALTPKDARQWAQILLALEQASQAAETQRIVIQWVTDKEPESGEED